MKQFHMKYFCFLLFSIAITSLSHAQKTITLEDINQHVGDSVRIEGKIFSGRFLSNSTGAPTLLNMGALYPNQKLTLVIWRASRKNFDAAPEVSYTDQTVWVTGKIEMLKGKPQMVLWSKTQIGVIEEEDIQD